MFSFGAFWCHLGQLGLLSQSCYLKRDDDLVSYWLIPARPQTGPLLSCCHPETEIPFSLLLFSLHRNGGLLLLVFVFLTSRRILPSLCLLQNTQTTMELWKILGARGWRGGVISNLGSTESWSLYFSVRILPGTNINLKKSFSDKFINRIFTTFVSDVIWKFLVRVQRGAYLHSISIHMTTRL